MGGGIPGLPLRHGSSCPMLRSVHQERLQENMKLGSLSEKENGREGKQIITTCFFVTVSCTFFVVNINNVFVTSHILLIDLLY